MRAMYVPATRSRRRLAAMWSQPLAAQPAVYIYATLECASGSTMSDRTVFTRVASGYLNCSIEFSCAWPELD